MVALLIIKFSVWNEIFGINLFFCYSFCRNEDQGFFVLYDMFVQAEIQEMVSYDLALHSTQYLILSLLILISLILIPLDWRL